MRKPFLIMVSLVHLVGAALADPVDKSVAEHIIPGFANLATATNELKKSSETCSSDVDGLRAAYHSAFDAWMGVSHLRFGPTEVDDRAYSLAFWPDKKDFTGKAVSSLVKAQSDVVSNPKRFHEVSIGARGFYALERLLFDPQDAPTDYECALIQAISIDMSRATTGIINEWQGSFAEIFVQSDAKNAPYQSEKELVQELYKALTSGLEFVADVRLGRPLGTFERARPRRADARRSGRPLRNVVLSLKALKPFALILADEFGPQLPTDIEAAFDRTIGLGEALDDPNFEGVSEIGSRLKIEIVQIEVRRISDLLAADLGPALGVTPGFNALDGD